MNKIVKLSVHKNNAIQRRTKQFRKDAVRNFKVGIKEKDIIGYAYISWDKSGAVSSGYSVSEEVPYPTITIPELSKISLLRRVLE